MKMKPSHPNERGVALVLVLSFLVIISALAIAFFSSVTTELRASKNFQSGVSTHQLQDSVVNIVEGQIRQATVPNTFDSSTQNRAWASQPGMIQTFGDGSGGASSNMLLAYKLYSSDHMTATAVGNTVAPDYISNWDASPALWTDLNAPIMVPDPTGGSNPVPRFPIIDPRALYNANNGGSPLVEGFNYAASPVSVSGNSNDPGSVDGLKIATGDNSARLPMPVKWIYILKDGELASPAGGTGSIATFSGSVTPTKANPIVGRVAFWTDDDTCKLNINTAAGSSWINAGSSKNADGYTQDQYAGSYWDTPRVNSLFDQGAVWGPGMTTPTWPAPGFQQGTSGNGGNPLPNMGGLASNQMLQNEFQRYPGHPATTSLALVFANMMNSEQLYHLLPRTAYDTYVPDNPPGGSSVGQNSRGGTQRLHLLSASTSTANATGVVQDVPLFIRYDRLYDSVDEMLFAYKSIANDSNGLPLRQLNMQYANLPNYGGGGYTPGTAYATNALTPGMLDQIRFFLTAYNRSPDLNLFGHPRVCVWPIRSQNYTADTTPASTGLTAYDSLSLFCSTIGPSVYNYSGNNSGDPSGGAIPFHYSFFRLENTAATVNAANQDIYITRNAQLLSYLQKQVANPVPGFGVQSLAAKYGGTNGFSNMNTILVQIFDYIRCANLYDTSVTVAPTTTNPHPFARNGIVVPSSPQSGPLNGNLGMGRFPTLCEATLVFYYAGSDKSTGNAAGTLYAKSATAFPGGTISGVAVGAGGSQKTESSGVLVITPPDNPGPYGAKVSQVPTMRYMRAALLLSTFNPMQGYGPVQSPTASEPKISYAVTGLNTFTVGGKSSVSAPDGTSATPTVDVANSNGNVFGTASTGTVTLSNTSGDFWGGRNFGGFEGFAHTLWNGGTTYPLQTSSGYKMGLSLNLPTPIPNGNFDYEETQVPTFRFNGGTATVQVSYGGMSPPLQTITLSFPAGVFPAPRGDDIIDAEPFLVSAKTLLPVDASGNPLTIPILAKNQSLAKDNNSASYSNGIGTFTGGGPQPYGQLRRWYWQSDLSSFDPNASRTIPAAASSHPQGWPISTDARDLSTARDFQLRINYALASGGNSDNPTSTSATGTVTGWHGNRWRQILQPGDTVRSLIFCAPPATGTTARTPSGDLRLAALTQTLAAPPTTVFTGTGSSTVPPVGFYPHPDYFSNTFMQASLLRMADGELYFPYSAMPSTDTFFAGAAAAGANGPNGYSPTLNCYSRANPFGNHVTLGSPSKNGLNGFQFPQAFAMAQLPRKLSASTGTWVNGVANADFNPGDFDTGVGQYADGPFFNKQDEGNAIFAYLNTQTGVTYYPIPYFGNGAYSAPGSAFNSPNRQMPSPAMIGSLMSRVYDQRPWETLCLCPNPAAGVGTTHHGNVDPKDHLLLDLFTMPVVQPYPISEPFSTAGRVNMNFQIQPFDYIERSTALRAVLASTRVGVMQSNLSVSTYTANGTGTTGNLFQLYKGGSQMTYNVRLTIDRPSTVGIIKEALKENGLFRSPSQICEIFLVPTGSTVGGATLAAISNSAQGFWQNNGDLTGDNMREKPYADLYPRLTTKSNTYTIHMKVQALRQVVHNTDSQYATWDDSKDQVVGEYRGSASIERYIDPADRHFNVKDPVTVANGDFVNPDTSNLIESLYRFRTVNTKLFAPY